MAARLDRARACATTRVTSSTRNIFYPSPNPRLPSRTRRSSRESSAAPLFWLGLPPVLDLQPDAVRRDRRIRARDVRARARADRRDGSRRCSAAAVFTMAPYRIEHFMHLELQWAMWVPLTFWALHLTLTQPDRTFRYGLLAGLFIWLQIASCVYYGVFLAVSVAAYMAVELAMNWRRVHGRAACPCRRRGSRRSAYRALFVGVPRYGAAHGDRATCRKSLSTADGYSSYFAAPRQNWLRGWSAGSDELNLFLGWNAMALALAGLLLYRHARQRVAYGVVAAVSITLSLGLNTPLYAWLVRIVADISGPSLAVTILHHRVLRGRRARGLRRLGAEQASARAGPRYGWIVLPPSSSSCCEYANTGLILVDRLERTCRQRVQGDRGRRSRCGRRAAHADGRRASGARHACSSCGRLGTGIPS